MDVIKSADWVIDLGPEAGDGGGELVFSGKPVDLKKCKGSHIRSAISTGSLRNKLVEIRNSS